MSHSKYTKRGKSLYVEHSNPDAKRFINTCALCGAQGYRPTIDEDGFTSDLIHKVIRAELKRIFSPLPLDNLGRCADCAKIMEKN